MTKQDTINTMMDKNTEHAQIFGEVKATVEHMQKDILEIKKGIDKIHERITTSSNRAESRVREAKDNFVSKEEFRPVKTIVYGLVAVVLLSVLATILYYTGFSVQGGGV